MGMSTHVIGIRPPDEKWKKMKAAWDACNAAGIAAPKEVQDFFGYDNPDEAGVVVALEPSGCIRNWGEDSRAGFEVDVSKLPKDVTIIRFYNSW